MASTRTARRPSPDAHDSIAAGGVVYRDGPLGIEVVVAGRDRDGTWVFPKGQPDPGESIEETALREVREESGLDVRALKPLGAVEYWFAASGERVHKLVHFFLMEPTGGDLSLHDHEYDEVRWVSVSEARRMLSFDTYREVLDRAIAAIAA
ncbi:MAG: NUDIX hydrolase [Chloroflexi bacterium]|nr:NUDIX hydrolase [Chloroflexota bacterium]